MFFSYESHSMRGVFLLSQVLIHGALAFLDALASLDLKLSVSQWVSDVFQLAHLRVF